MPMPKPGEKEGEQDFVSRFMGDPAMVKEYPDEKQRAAVAYATFRRRHDNSISAWPKRYSCRFIEPGLVQFKEYGTCLLRRETLDRMLPSFVGKPVINEIHRDDIRPDIYEKGEADGVVTGVHVEPDGWFWADLLVWDESTKRNIESKAYGVSCSYIVRATLNEGGTHNMVPYNQEITDAEYEHMAVVVNPRYEGARVIFYNSREDGKMKLKFWNLFKKDGATVKNAGEAEMEKTVKVDGKDVPLKELVDTYKAEEAEIAKKKELADGMTEDTVIEIDGKEPTLGNLVNCYKARNARKNAEDEEAKKKEHDEKHRENSVDGCSHCAARKNAADEEAAKKKAEEEAEAKRKNAEDEEKRKAEEKKKEDERKNAEEAEKKRKEEEEAERKKRDNSSVNKDLHDAAMRRGSVQTATLQSREERIAEGRRRYGPVEAVK